MIQPKELRLGNYIEYRIQDELDERKDWWELSTIDATDIAILESGIDEDFRPIPLTEGILLKFGFDKKQIREELKNKFGDYAFSLNNIPFYTLIEANDGFMLSKFETYITTVVYIHQIQNLFFCLCGKELQLNSE